ncbi:U6 small nuclear RNA (adenine-(43)-N(6))-methyltransferase [Anabrus simplex]|uniref:U6 small nuclear RNA (adenine-(43)-N(6))-methyltransferase n=1 Tax=Anabrus simplex TaxID=316456 RepID=UPI0035A2F3B2
MSLNKFMHPRNIYRKPPNFKELAIKYPEFRECVKVELTGKVKLDFKKPEALRALTCTLLKKDFGLDVEIPLNRLIPTLPLRLNYLLWVEDLLKVLKTDCEKNQDIVRGIDIGTGASCIYSLLASKQNKWHMLATDVDSEIIAVAQRNVDKNDMAHFITVKAAGGDTLLKGVLEPDVVYDFCMCNPPFFSSEDELDPVSKSRSPSRHPPHNAPTGSVGEVVVEGGEVAFIVRLMKESKELGTAVRIYTTKVGQKSSLLLLMVELRKLGVTSSAQTEFCQGNTARWGLAWTFLPDVDLKSAFSIKSGPRKKNQVPMSFCVPREAVGEDEMYSLDVIAEKVISLLQELQITYKVLCEKQHMKTLQICAVANTWSNQRRKRREKLRQRMKGIKMDEDNKSDKETTLASSTSMGKATSEVPQQNISPSGIEQAATTDILLHNEGSEDSLQSTGREKTNGMHGSESELSQDGLSSVSGKRSRDSEEEEEEDEEVGSHRTKRLCTSSETEGQLESYVLKATLFLRLLASNIHIELIWLEGSGGKDAMHQILQYLKNRLK